MRLTTNQNLNFKDRLRSQFLLALSQMYEREVPQYKKLKSLINQVNNEYLSNHPNLEKQLSLNHGEPNYFYNLYKDVYLERHGAIRLGLKSELNFICRLFASMGMVPVGYYDLSESGIPVHATAFRAVDEKSIRENPFRMFCSLLRPELIEDKSLKDKLEKILNQRDLVSDKLLSLIIKTEISAKLNSAETHQFIELAVSVFCWHKNATVSKQVYDLLSSCHPLISDISAFKCPHINHLTKTTFDIAAVHKNMKESGFDTKLIIEGPPLRKCPILLRQTAFNAVSEPIIFKNELTHYKAGHQEGFHRARFGEVEQRGCALTPKGMELYDKLLSRVNSQIKLKKEGSNAASYNRILKNVFKIFPDNYQELREKKLACFKYALVDKKFKNKQGLDLETLIKQGKVNFEPIVYQDFLPVSASGIFRSNLKQSDNLQSFKPASKKEFEKALGREVLDYFKIYQEIENLSIQALVA